ncbi:MAG: hypothetical protein DWI22_20350, partial [Planctomycetota bacterium]
KRIPQRLDAVVRQSLPQFRRSIKGPASKDVGLFYGAAVCRNAAPKDIVSTNSFSPEIAREGGRQAG